MARPIQIDDFGNPIYAEDETVDDSIPTGEAEETPVEAEPEPEVIAEPEPDIVGSDGGGVGSTAGDAGDHDPDPVSLGDPATYMPQTEGSAIFNPSDPSAGFSRKLRGLGGVQDITNLYQEAPGQAQAGALIEELLRILSENGTA